MSTTTPNRRAVAKGVELPEMCNNPEHKWEVALSLKRDFLPKLVKFTGSTNTVIAAGGSGDTAIALIEIEGPRQGFIWDIRSINICLMPLIVGGVAQAHAAFLGTTYAFEVDPGSIDKLDNWPNPNANLFGDFTSTSVVETLGATINFNEQNATLNPGKNLALYLNNIGTLLQGQYYLASGQAIAVPQAYYDEWLGGS